MVTVNEKPNPATNFQHEVYLHIHLTDSGIAMANTWEDFYVSFCNYLHVYLYASVGSIHVELQVWLWVLGM